MVPAPWQHRLCKPIVALWMQSGNTARVLPRNRPTAGGEPAEGPCNVFSPDKIP